MRDTQSGLDIGRHSIDRLLDRETAPWIRRTRTASPIFRTSESSAILFARQTSSNSNKPKDDLSIRLKQRPSREAIASMGYST